MAYSIILTSGTLSPIDSFASELGTKFEVILEGKLHCVPSNQIFLSAVGISPDGKMPLSCNYKTQDTTEYQDALGETILEYIKVNK